MTDKPNILIIVTDQQQAATVDPGSPCQTPALDGLARDGVRFTRAYTVNAICSPTRASLLTGVLPSTHGMVDCTHTVPVYRAKLDTSLETWCQRLRAAGYTLGYCGTWHVERSSRLEQGGVEDYCGLVEHAACQVGAVSRAADLVAHEVALGLGGQAQRPAIVLVPGRPAAHAVHAVLVKAKPLQPAAALYVPFAKVAQVIARSAQALAPHLEARVELGAVLGHGVRTVHHAVRAGQDPWEQAGARRGADRVDRVGTRYAHPVPRQLVQRRRLARRARVDRGGLLLVGHNEQDVGLDGHVAAPFSFWAGRS